MTTDLICENCGLKETEMEPEYAGPVQCYRSFDANGECREYLCQFCVRAEIAAGIPHELVNE